MMGIQRRKMQAANTLKKYSSSEGIRENERIAMKYIYMQMPYFICQAGKIVLAKVSKGKYRFSQVC